MKLNVDKYKLAVIVISVVVAFLTHFPEMISLFDHSGQDNLFPGMRLADVANGLFHVRFPADSVYAQHFVVRV